MKNRTRVVARYVDSGNEFAMRVFDYSSDEALGEVVGELVAHARKKGISAKNVEIIVRMLEEFPDPVKHEEGLSQKIIDIITDGYTAEDRNDCPYDRNSEELTERASRIFWNRGFAFRENGKSLQEALSTEI